MTTATATWVNREATAEELIPLIGKLHRRSLVNKSVIELLKLHDFVSHIDGAPLNPAHSLELVRALVELNLGACSINIAALHKAHHEAGSPELSMWLPEQLGSSVNHQGDQPKEQDVVL
ncbi:MAG: glyceraldehyde-3-phosphate dehydrogenase, partial [Rothia mucilaginosa]